MIERAPEGKGWVLVGKPTIVSKSRALLTCGCTCYVGVRMDNKEAASKAGSCGSEHEGLVMLFTMKLRASLENPTSRPLVEVADELLKEAALDFAADYSQEYSKNE